MIKKCISILLALSMLLLVFAACSGDSLPASSTNGSEGSNAEGDGDDTISPADDGPTVNITVATFTSGDSSGADDVAAEISKISVEKINVEMTLTMINTGSWQEQLNLMLSSGEELDIFPVGQTPVSTYVNNGQIIELDDLLEQYGQDIPTVIDPMFLNAGRVNGALYGITTNRDLANYYGFFMRKDMADQYNIDYENISTLDELEKALTIIRDSEPDMYPLTSGVGGMMINAWGWDPLGDRLGVLLNSGIDNLDVVNLYETDHFKDFVTRMRRWEQMGLIMPDSANNQDSAEANMMAGKVFGGFGHLKPNSYLTKQRSSTHEIAIATLLPATTNSSNVIGHMWSIATNSKNPEKAMQMLNLMYIDPDVTNLLIFGIEGTHWQFLDEENDIIGYVDGVDTTNTNYTPVLGWMWPNQFVGHIWVGDEPDVWEVLDTFNKNSTPSMALGFVFDNAAVKNEVTACTAVVDKYYNSLMCGSIDPETALPQFNQELKDAGIDNIVAEKQRQLDEWNANNS